MNEWMHLQKCKSKGKNAAIPAAEAFFHTDDDMLRWIEPDSMKKLSLHTKQTKEYEEDKKHTYTHAHTTN